jgi:hypothetical protein
VGRKLFVSLEPLLGRCETLGLTVADIGLGRSLVSAWWCFDSVSGYTNRALIQAGGSGCPSIPKALGLHGEVNGLQERVNRRLRS